MRTLIVIAATLVVGCASSPAPTAKVAAVDTGTDQGAEAAVHDE